MKSAKEWSDTRWDAFSNKVSLGEWIEAIQTDARAELLDRLFKYEAQWNDMNFTICKLEQDLRKAKGEQ